MTFEVAVWAMTAAATVGAIWLMVRSAGRPSRLNPSAPLFLDSVCGLADVARQMGMDAAETAEAMKHPPGKTCDHCGYFTRNHEDRFFEVIGGRVCLSCWGETQIRCSECGDQLKFGGRGFVCRGCRRTVV